MRRILLPLVLLALTSTAPTAQVAAPASASSGFAADRLARIDRLFKSNLWICGGSNEFATTAWNLQELPVHRMALLPNGDLLLTRTRKVQRLKFLGVS